MKALRIFTAVALSVAVLRADVQAFCGFYVAKADVSLYNKYSQVIMVRDGNHTTITMSNDFRGTVKDFAMVVPVPVVLKKDQIRVADRGLFDRLDAYTTPRMVEYYDENPCEPRVLCDSMTMSRSQAFAEEKSTSDDFETQKDLGVRVEATYTVGEYDIVILSAEESGGLETWLVQNGYKIPEGAKEVLEPYVKSNMKFFVVKVNLEEQKNSGFQTLRPLQISFDSPKYMLPIRLGMANATEDQDLIVYSFTRNGRTETSNYRNVRLTTDKDVPEFVQPEFGRFYADLFTRQWKKNGKNAVYTEYAWDLSGTNYVKCDPCPVQPPYIADLREAGVNWLQPDSWGGYGGNCFVTRMHVRYNRKTFPQDLMFQETADKQSFQCRYVMHHMATGDLSCEAGQEYLRTLVSRRTQELMNLQELTGWDVSKHWDYVTQVSRMFNPSGSRSGGKDGSSSSAQLPPGTDTDPQASQAPTGPGVTGTAAQGEYTETASWAGDEAGDAGMSPVWKMAAILFAGLTLGMFISRKKTAGN